jgi:hypothetical protein
MFTFKKNNLLPAISDKFRRTDTNLVYLFTNARDEPNISEWIAHHLLLGFDKIIVFDHLSSEPIISKLGTNFDNKVNIIRVQGSGNVKLQFMKDAVNIANNNNVSWMLYLDADEFLLLNKYDNIKNYLRLFTQADSIGINWLMFGSSGHTTQPKGLLTENFIRSDIRLNQHVKSFIRPYIVTDVPNPHFYKITNPNRCYTGNGTKMQMGPFNPQPLPFINSLSYIAHYYVQSEEEHKRRKGRVLDDGTPNKLGLENDIHKIHNNVTNNQLQNKYSQRIRAFLKNYNIEL